MGFSGAQAMTIRTSAILSAGLLLIAAHASAQDAGYGYAYSPNGDSNLPAFAGLRGSISMNSTIHTSVAAGTIPLRGSLSMSGGGSIYAGVRLPLGFRAELEGVYRYQPLKSLTISGVPVSATGQMHLAGPMLNVMWDIPVPDFPFRPYVGLGIGGLYTDLTAKSGGVKVIDGSKWNVSYQAIAGAEFPLSQSSRLTADYRWLQVHQARMQCTAAPLAAQSCRANINTQSVDLGLEFDL